MTNHVSDFNYTLPEALIAQDPLTDRTSARLMVLNRSKRTIDHHHIRELPDLLNANDVLVFNQTRVFPARLHGVLEGHSVEVLLHRDLQNGQWECLTKPGRRFKETATVTFPEGMSAQVHSIQPDGTRVLVFSQHGQAFEKWVDRVGEMPLPPYIKSSHSQPSQYQTVYARERGSVAAPTAGLHFTQDLLATLRQKGIQEEFVTLHVGRGTFEPMKGDRIEDHVMHRESYELSPKSAEALTLAKQEGKRIIAVGTTSTRVLETCGATGPLLSHRGETQLFITPGYTFKWVNGLLTNFHLPKSTLLMLVSAFADREFILKAYEEAIRERYRFFSFGDAMLIL